jgi:hypothetical protein
MSSPWRQPVPCDNCPFNSEGEGLYLRRSLARGRFQQICDDLKAGLTFNCHKTTHETGDGTELVCAGAIKWSNDRGYSSNFLLKDRATDDDTEYSTTWFPVFAVGEQADLAAGMQGGAVSPWCKTEAEAYAWCNDNFDFLAGMYKDD